MGQPASKKRSWILCKDQPSAIKPMASEPATVAESSESNEVELLDMDQDIDDSSLDISEDGGDIKGITFWTKQITNPSNWR